MGMRPAEREIHISGVLRQPDGLIVITHPAATSLASSASLAPLPQAGGAGGGHCERKSWNDEGG